MKRLMIATVATVVMLGAVTSPVLAQSWNDAALINGWYERYLGRPADSNGLVSWSQQLRYAGPEAVQAGILASDEYWNRTGQSPVTFVTALYRDVLGRQASSYEVWDWARRLHACGSRERLALDFVVAAQTELAQRPAPPVFVPAPVRSPVLLPHRMTGFRNLTPGLHLRVQYASPR